MSIAAVATAGCDPSLIRDDSERVRHMLDLPSLPASVRGVSCEQAFSVDTDIGCAFDIDSADFTVLLTGRKFTSRPDSGRAHAQPIHPGPDFSFTIAYSTMWQTWEPGHKQQHSATIRVDSQRRHVLLDYGGW